MAISGRLTVLFHEGKDLIEKDIGKQDPFCSVSIGKEKLKTKTHAKGGKNPQWGGQALLFNLKGVDGKECLHVQCFDEDLLSNDKIGRCDLPLKQLFEQAWEKKEGTWFQLVDFDNFKKIAGYIRISIIWDGEHPSKFGFDIAKAKPAPAPAAPAPAPEPAPAPAPAPAVQRPVTVQQPIIVQPPIVVQPQQQQPPQVVYQQSYGPQYQPQPVYMQPGVMQPVMYGQPQPVYAQPQPMYQPMLQPVYQQTGQPVYQAPGQPVYQAPGQPFFQVRYQ